MTLRDRATNASFNSPSLSTIADYSEVIALLAAATLVLTVAAFGASGIFVGFSMALAMTFANFAAGVFLIGLSFFAVSLLIGLIEQTYYVEPDESETLPEQAADAQEEEGPEYEQIGERREPEEHRVK